MRLITPEQRSALEQIDTPTVSNAIELFEVRDRAAGFIGSQVRCLFPNLGIRLGYAVTVIANSTTPGQRPDLEMEWRIWEAVEKSPKPVYVVFQNTGHLPLRSCFLGEMMGSMAAGLGAAAILTDGGIRDIEPVGKLGLQIYSCGLVASHGTFRVLDVNLPVQIDGMAVEPGALLHGDANGVVSIPESVDIDDLIERCHRFLEREKAMLEYIHSPQLSAAGLRKWYGLGEVH